MPGLILLELGRDETLNQKAMLTSWSSSILVLQDGDSMTAQLRGAHMDNQASLPLSTWTFQLPAAVWPPRQVRWWPLEASVLSLAQAHALLAALTSDPVLHQANWDCAATAEQRAACVAELFNTGEGGDSWIAQSGDVRGLPHALRGESQVVVLGAEDVASSPGWRAALMSAGVQPQSLELALSPPRLTPFWQGVLWAAAIGAGIWAAANGESHTCPLPR